MVKYILRHGMAAEKLVLGVPLFGRSYTLAASTLPAPGAAVSDWGDEGIYTQTKGMLAYFEVNISRRTISIKDIFFSGPFVQHVCLFFFSRLFNHTFIFYLVF